ncbi:MAG TPA: hypothetical protein VFP84_39620 [Kofleriaceae bacterium]|nr:hypothetical protein [Kofleriaceae bacterium]
MENVLLDGPDGLDDAEVLTPAIAEEMLHGAALVAPLGGSIPEMKALRDRCLAAGIPALIGCPGGGGASCGPKTHLLLEQAELPKLAALLHNDWSDQLAREGMAEFDLAALNAAAEASAEHPPCPACGTAAALVDGACSDCGLQLE